MANPRGRSGRGGFVLQTARFGKRLSAPVSAGKPASTTGAAFFISRDVTSAMLVSIASFRAAA
jgi:hypothetical protein